MKKLLITVCSIMILSIVTFVQAQDQDTTSASYNQGAVEENKDNTVDNSSGELKQGTISIEDQAQEGGNPTQEQIDQVTEGQGTPPTEMGDATPVTDKVGPHGESLFMENGKYYYLNENGDKVKVGKSKLKDKSQ